MPPPGQLLENIRRGKRNVHEEGECAFRPLVPDQPAHVHQLIVLDPDHVAGLRSLKRDSCEALIDPLVKLPVTRREVTARLKIVEEWPQNFVGEAFVKVGLFFSGQEDGKIPDGCATRCGCKQPAYLGVMGLAIAGKAGIAHPGAAIFGQNWIQRADQAAARGNSRHIAALVLFDRDRKPV